MTILDKVISLHKAIFEPVTYFAGLVGDAVEEAAKDVVSVFEKTRVEQLEEIIMSGGLNRIAIPQSCPEKWKEAIRKSKELYRSCAVEAGTIFGIKPIIGERFNFNAPENQLFSIAQFCMEKMEPINSYITEVSLTRPCSLSMDVIQRMYKIIRARARRSL